MDVNELKAAADFYENAYNSRLAADKVAAELKVVEVEAKKKLIWMMQEAKAENVVGTNKLFTLKEREQPVVDDWEKLYAHMLATGNMALLQRRLSVSTVEEILLDGGEIPGVNTMPVFDISRGKKL